MALASTVHLPAAVLGRRASAVLAAFSAGLHALMIGHVDNLAVAGLVVAMVVACLYCARDLWSSGSLRSWCVVAVMSLAMVAIHWSVPECHPGTVAGSATPASTWMITASSVALAEAAIATAVLFYRTRDRAVALSVGQRELG
jgi:hypothetical protein